MSATRLSTLATAQSRESTGSPRPRQISGHDAQSRRSAKRHDTVIKLREYEMRYNEIRSEVAWEQFSATKDALIGLAKELQFVPNDTPPYADPTDDVLRSAVHSIVYRGSSARWSLLIKVLRRLAHTYLKETAIGFHLHEIALATDDPNTGVAVLNEYKRNAAVASSLLLAADRSGWFLDSSSRDSQIIGSVACQSLHGLSLGFLGRFREAQRKLDEASGLLTACSLADDPLELGIIELRRAAVFLLQARMLRNNSAPPGSNLVDATDLRRAAGASVEDARRCLERARDLLAGNSRIVSWWARLYINQLRACALGQGLFEPRDKRFDESSTSSWELAKVAHRSALLLRPIRTSVMVKACHYFVYAVTDEEERSKRAKACSEDLKREQVRIENLPADKRPDRIVSHYLEVTTKAIQAIADPAKKRSGRAAR